MRQYRSDDLEHVHRLMSDPTVMRYYEGVCDREHSQRILANALASYEKLGYSVLALERKSDGHYLGHAGLLHWDGVDAREDVEVAYMLLPEYWGHGSRPRRREPPKTGRSRTLALTESFHSSSCRTNRRNGSPSETAWCG